MEQNIGDLPFIRVTSKAAILSHEDRRSLKDLKAFLADDLVLFLENFGIGTFDSRLYLKRPQPYEVLDHSNHERTFGDLGETNIKGVIFAKTDSGGILVGVARPDGPTIFA